MTSREHIRHQRDAQAAKTVSSQVSTQAVQASIASTKTQFADQLMSILPAADQRYVSKRFAQTDEGKAYAEAIQNFKSAMSAHLEAVKRYNRAAGHYKKMYGRNDGKETKAREKCETLEAALLASMQVVLNAHHQTVAAASALQA